MCAVITFSRLALARTRMVANPARVQLNRENGIFRPCLCLRFWSRELGSAVSSRVSPLILHTQAESGAYLREPTAPSHVPLRFLLEPLCAIGLIVPSLSGHAIALPMAFTTENRQRSSNSQGSSINGNSFQVTPWTNYCTPLFSHTHYWYIGQARTSLKAMAQ